MINPDDRSTGLNGNSTHGAASIPKCVCSWKNCRTYQKGFREAQHPVMDGAIKLKFVKDHPASQALKDSIDRVLRVVPEKAEDWKPGRKEGQKVIRYYVARHHYTEKHIQKYLGDPKGFSFLKPFSVHGAKKYLFTVDPSETFQLPNGDPKGEPLYLQCPNVPKEIVKAEFQRLKEDAQQQQQHLQQQVMQQQQQVLQQQQPQPAKTKQAITTTQPSSQRPSHPKQSVGDKKDSLTVSTTRSSSQHHQNQLKHKEQENKKLKDELEMMKSQLTFLHDMVRKLQEEHFGGNQSVAPSTNHGGGNDHMSVKSGRSYRSRSVSNRQQRGSGRSARSGVPREICMDEDDNAREQWNERGDDWTEYQDDQTDTNRHYDEDEDEETTATFQVTYKAARRYSNGTQASRGAASIVSASRSVKTLPRELELDEDEDDSDSHESLEEEAFDNRSFASTVHSRHSRHSRSGHRRYCDEEEDEEDNPLQQQQQQQQQQQHQYRNPMDQDDTPPSRSGNAMAVPQQQHGDGRENANRKPSRRNSVGSQRSSRSSRSVTSGAGTYEVSAMDVTDPYGEKGTYTGSISNSTGMPHGFGRLEYDRAGRWYEGDWKHGRWTGHGRLSNGDGDFYEGGLKNDHKHGQGMMKFADGRTFEGEYINGQMIEGRMTYQDGSTYSGSWVDGMRHGRGKCVFTDDSIYEGEFREGEFSGHGKMAWSDGGWYEGEWWNGEMHGKGKEVRPDGSVRHDGEWCKGQPIRQ